MEDKECACNDEFVMGIDDAEVLVERLDDQTKSSAPKLHIFIPNQPETNDKLGKELDNKTSSSINSFKKQVVPGNVNTCSEEGKKLSKKLCLSQQQFALLDTNFNKHSIISSAEKQELANQTHLSARQVEVWFQNQRARTRHKRREENRELLKRCCETLMEENERLKEELIELTKSKKLKFSSEIHTPPTSPSYHEVKKSRITCDEEAKEASMAC